MSPASIVLAATVVAAPAIAFAVYRLARGLGFLDPAMDKQHEHRRTIVVALYALLLFLPVLFYGFEKQWPRAWVLFGIATGLALLVTSAIGIRSAVLLWKLRHPPPTEAPPAP
jgi:predicted Na+-dependent transporter